MLKFEKNCANVNGRKRGAGAQVSGGWILGPGASQVISNHLAIRGSGLFSQVQEGIHSLLFSKGGQPEEQASESLVTHVHLGSGGRQKKRTEGNGERAVKK